MRAVVAAAALGALAVAAGTGTYLAVRSDEPEPTTTTTTTVPAEPTPAEIAATVVASLERGLEVPLAPAESACIGRQLLDVVGVDTAATWVEGPTPDLDGDQRAALVRAVVECVPEATARALLGVTTTTTRPDDLPDE